MRTRDLDNLIWEKIEAESLAARIEELSAEKTTTQITGMPGGCSISDHTGDMASTLADLKEILLGQYHICLKTICDLQTFINSIDDPEIRVVFTFRFISCMSYRDIAKKCNYADHSVVWKKIDNYLNGIEKKQCQRRSEQAKA